MVHASMAPANATMAGPAVLVNAKNVFLSMAKNATTKDYVWQMARAIARPNTTTWKIY
jgi:hypothetical protein|tara:strand:- start:2321 stop:2494 length:174 start_codon:yes stop_codon:yes gene_type:complete